MSLEEYSFKLIVMGDAGVGKTSLVNMQCYSKFDDKLPMTVGVAGVTCKIELSGKTIELNIWDTAGQEQYSALIPMFSRGADVCILVADATNMQSVKNLPRWESLLSESGSIPPIVVAVNKSDLVPKLDARTSEITNEVMAVFNRVMFVSAKTGEGVQMLFQLAAELALSQAVKAGDHIKLEDNESGASGGCC